MKRVTNQDVNDIVTRINKALNRPLTYSNYAAPPAGEPYKFRANKGHFMHHSTGQLHQLAVVMNENGGIAIVLSANSRRELVWRCDAYLKGIYQVQYGTTSSSAEVA